MELYERYLTYGYINMKEQELLELILYSAGYDALTKSKAERLLKTYGSLSNILSKDNKVMLKDKRVNTRFLVIKKLINEFFYEDYLLKLEKFGPILSNSEVVIEFLRQQFAYDTKEKFGIIFLSTNYELIKYESDFVGTIDRAVIYIRELVEKILLCNAKNIIIVHNHPSGLIYPSDEDIRLTKRLKEGLYLLEINLVDHIVISKSGYFSFIEKGVL